MGKSQKKRLIQAHARTMKKWLLVPYTVIRGGHDINMLHIESR